jgi:hypothetical protein
MRRLRGLLLFELGALTGLAAAGAFVKRAIPSRGDADSDELALVAVLDGTGLKSRSKAFRGGSILAWLGGIHVDLSDAELAPDARLTVHTLFGGVTIKTPPEWRIESNAKVVMGGVDVRSPAQDDPDAPVLTLDGLAVFGGIEVGSKADRHA